MVGDVLSADTDGSLLIISVIFFMGAGEAAEAFFWVRFSETAFDGVEVHKAPFNGAEISAGLHLWRLQSEHGIVGGRCAGMVNFEG